MRVELYRLDSERVQLASGVLDEKGVFETTGETPVPPGVYEAVFHVGGYYRGAGVELPDPAFLEDVPFRFGVAAGQASYHLPMKMTPWGFSLFRGA